MAGSSHGVSGTNSPRKGEFFVMSPEVGGPGHWVEFENAQKLRPPMQPFIRPDDGGFPQFPERPRLKQTRRGFGPNDLDSNFEGYWLVSKELKQVFEAVDPEGFSFAPCDYVLHDGEAGAEYFLCDVVRALDAIDDSASDVVILTEGFAKEKFYKLAFGARLAFRKDVIKGAHVFCSPFNDGLVVCDRSMRDELVKHGFGLDGVGRGVYLEDAAEYFLS